MEDFIILLVLALIGIVFVLPIAAFIRSGRAVHDAEVLRQKVASIEGELLRLKHPLPSQSTSSQPISSPSPGTADVPPAPIGTGPSESATPPEFRAAVPVAPVAPAEPPTLPPLVRVSPAVVASMHAPVPPPLGRPLLKFDWEQFMGVKLFAWLGGLALFLAVAYFVKYSFDRDLIPPEVRVALGFLAGLGLLVGGVMLKRRQYSVTSHTLCATGVVVLYAVTFACRAVYHFSFFGPLPTFLLMVLITATAFMLAVRLNAMVVAILGMVGGFLTPVLLSTGVDNPVGLFTYLPGRFSTTSTRCGALLVVASVPAAGAAADADPFLQARRGVHPDLAGNPSRRSARHRPRPRHGVPGLDRRGARADGAGRCGVDFPRSD